MKINLSEELVINDDISLGNDEEKEAKEIEKSAEEYEKEVNKELEDKVKDVEEINEFEAKPIEIHDAEDKKLKIKGLTEKLILEEPSDILTEAKDIDDILFELRDQCVRDIHNELHSYLKHCEYANIDYPFSTKEAAIDALESICEEAIYHMDDILDNSGMLTEEVLDEKIPQDLAKGYKAWNYKGAGSAADLENATYDAVSPEEGFKLYKEDPTQVRLLVNGKLIDFRSNGKPSDHHRIDWLDNDKAFRNRNGKIVRDTMYIPPKELFKLADKVYVTNEAKPEGQKDRNLLTTRSQNYESPNYSGKSLPTYNLTDRWSGELRGDAGSLGSIKRLERYIKRNLDYAADAKRNADYYRNNGDEGNAEYYENRAKSYEKEADQYKAKIQDIKARARYADSEKSLEAPFERYKNLKEKIRYAKRDVERSEETLNDRRANGSPQSRDNRQKLQNLQDRLADIKKQILMVELDLEGTDEEDAKAITAAENEFNSRKAEYDAINAELNALLRRS